MSHSKTPTKPASPTARIRSVAGPDAAPKSTKTETNPCPAGMAPTGAQSSTRAGTKRDAVLAMLRRPQGATLAAVMAATGWQEHSVRGFLAAVVRKKLGLTLASEKTDDARVYRIVAQDDAPQRKEKARRKAA